MRTVLITLATLFVVTFAVTGAAYAQDKATANASVNIVGGTTPDSSELFLSSRGGMHEIWEDKKLMALFAIVSDPDKTDEEVMVIDGPHITNDGFQIAVSAVATHRGYAPLEQHNGLRIVRMFVHRN